MPRGDPLRFLRGNASAFTALNWILLSGEPGFELDTGKMKVGDGRTAWNDLAYFPGVAGVSSFRLSKESRAPAVTESAPVSMTVEGFSVNDDLAGLASTVNYRVRNIVATLAGVTDVATTVVVTFEGIGVGDKVYTLTIAAWGATGRVTPDPDELLDLSEYQDVTIKAYCASEPMEPPAGLTVRVSLQYEPA